MATILITPSRKVNKDGKCESLIRFFHGKKIDQRAKSGIFFFPKHFVFEKGIWIIKINERIESPDIKKEKDQKELLDKLILFIDSSFRNLKDKNIPSDWLREQVDKFHNPTNYLTRIKQDAQKNIYELAEEYLEKKRFSYDHTKAFRVLVRDMARYESFCRLTGRNGKGFKWDIDKITKNDIEDFEDYLRTEKTLSDKYPKIFAELLQKYPVEISYKHKTPKLTNRGDNTIHKLLVKFKAFWNNWLLNRDLCTNNPFLGFKIGAEVYGTPYYLTKEERNTLADFDLSNNRPLETQRDIFIFQCLIGCRVGDLLRLTKDNINDGVLEYVPSKTKDKSGVNPRIPLTERALNLITKYEGVDDEGRLFPFISPQKYNAAIRKVMKIAGIDRNVNIRNSNTGETEIHPIYEVASSHMARRTFVGTLYKSVKDPNLIGRMSGHVENSRAFARYRDIDDNDLRDTIKNLD